MTLAARIALGLLLLVLLLVALAAWQLRTVEALARDNRTLAETSLELRRFTAELRGGLAETRDLTEKLRVLRDGEYAAELEVRREALGEEIDRLPALTQSPDELAAATGVARQWQRYVAAAHGDEQRLLATGSSAALDRLLAGLDSVSDGIETLAAASDDALATIAEAGALRAERALGLSVGVVALALLGGLFTTLLVVRSVAGPVARLQRATRSLGAGDLTHRVPAEGPPEFVALAADFNAMADRLEELEQAQRDFVSMVSHELKAPLASMQETLSLVLDGSLGPVDDEQREMLELNRRAASRLSRMIHSLLDLACLEAGVMEFDLSPRDLVELTRSVLLETQPSIQRRRLRLSTRLPPAPVPALIDAALFHQVVQNLVSNAVKFAPEGGSVEVTVASWDSAGRQAVGLGSAPVSTDFAGAFVAVADSGPGVPVTDRERIFERFHRLESDRSGTGLGLPIARGIVAGHGGRLWVEEGPEGGSLFVALVRSAGVGTLEAGDLRESSQP